MTDPRPAHVPDGLEQGSGAPGADERPLIESLSKDHRYLLTSHLQKAIRRGLPGEAAWAAGHLHQIDRGHLAGRLAVIAVEDVGAGDPAAVLAVSDEDHPWGARRFHHDKTEADRLAWQAVARRFARAAKDRTPCEWIACLHWLPEFVAQEGPWHQLNPHQSIDKAYDRARPWWSRGLHAWRAAGTEYFPAGDDLPKIPGAWDSWCDYADPDAADLMRRFGRKQIEPHPVFVPLALADRRADPDAACNDQALSPSPRLGPWLAAAVDKHTGEGARALRRTVRGSSLAQRLGDDKAYEALGRLQFWTEGGHTDRAWSYTTATTIQRAVRAGTLAALGLTAKELAAWAPARDLWWRDRAAVLEVEWDNTPDPARPAGETPPRTRPR